MLVFELLCMLEVLVVSIYIHSTFRKQVLYWFKEKHFLIGKKKKKYNVHLYSEWLASAKTLVKVGHCSCLHDCCLLKLYSVH